MDTKRDDDDDDDDEYNQKETNTHRITVLVVDREAQPYVQNTALRYAQTTPP
jgi:Fe-S cluster assembly iron-binding protein IscA